MTYFLRLLVMFVMGGVVVSCSNTTLVGSWKNPLFLDRIAKIYVVGLSGQETSRRLFEDRFVAGLASYGVMGFASYHDFPDASKTSKSIIAERVVKNRADAILISQIIGKHTKEIVIPGQATGYTYGPYYGRRGYYRPYPYYDNWPAYYDRSYAMVYEPPIISRFEVLSIECSLYTVKTSELIWSAQIETVLDRSLDAVVGQFVNTVLKDLNSQGLI